MKRIYQALFFCIFCSFTYVATSQCPGQVEVLVNIVPDNYGSETTWEFTGAGGTPVYASGGPYFDGNTTPINTSVCLDSNSLVIFTIYDTFGDGICCSYGSGSYEITIDANSVASGGNYAASESTVVWGTPLPFDCTMKTLFTPYSLVASNDNVTIAGRLLNIGGNDLTQISLNYQIGTDPVVVESFNPDTIPIFGSFDFQFSTLWSPQDIGNQNISVWISSVNEGNADMNLSNDTISTTIEVYQAVEIPNLVDDFLDQTPNYSTVADANQQVNKPNDLDFHPLLSRNELWIINEDFENSGGSTVTIFDPGTANQTTQWLRDGNAWHFMSMPTGIAFGTNGNWASSPGVFDASHDGGAPFTGPTLWSSDFGVYAQNAGPGTNGSHLDMLHETPYGMGICHHKNNAYWLFDGHAGNIVYYDFNQDHGPGMHDHSDGIIRRYTEVQVSKDSNVPSHLVMDKETGWLYIVDTGNDRILKMNTNTGNVKNTLIQTESVKEYVEMENVISEVIVDTGLIRPSGIDIVEDRMMVGDYTTGDIRFYDISVSPAEYLGSISTGDEGLTGLKFGPNGNVWFTNKLKHEVGKIEPAYLTGVNPNLVVEDIEIYPNPVHNQFKVKIPPSLSNNAQIQIVDALGREVLSISSGEQKQLTIDCTKWATGVYFLMVKNGKNTMTKAIQVL